MTTVYVTVNPESVSVLEGEVSGNTASDGFTVLGPGQQLAGRDYEEWRRAGEWLQGLGLVARKANHPALLALVAERPHMQPP